MADDIVFVESSCHIFKIWILICKYFSQAIDSTNKLEDVGLNVLHNSRHIAISFHAELRKIIGNVIKRAGFFHHEVELEHNGEHLERVKEFTCLEAPYKVVE